MNGRESRERGAPPWHRPERGVAALSPAATAFPQPGWEHEHFLALDFETTGLDPRRERVVEIGAVRFVPAVPADRAFLCAIVDPEKPMPSEAFAVHGIGDADLRGAPLFAALALPLLALASGATIVAHNAPFDLAFLRQELARSGLADRFEPRAVLDTRLLAKSAFPGLAHYGLADLAAALGLDAGRSHRALDDARTCMELFLRCAPILAPAAVAHEA